MKSTSIADGRERDALIALSFVEGVGIGTLRRLQQEKISYSDAIVQLVPAREIAGLHRRRLAVQQRAAAIGCDFLTFQDDDYPQSLLDLTDPPVLLFTKGSRAILENPVVAIVGTRTCTRYGDRVARELGAALASAGACVISGLAKGVDSAAHRGALAVSGKTCAVLGTGIDITYPVGHLSLQQSIAERGCIITECLPGASPSPGGFPKRNRIIAALAQVTIVVEAGVKSGALNTAKHAMNLGRDLACVPGAIDSMQSVGTNEYLRDGAHVIATIEDALSLVGVNKSRKPAAERELSTHELSILDAMGERQLTTQQLVEVSALPVSECLVAISSLEVDGFIEASLTGEFRRCATGSRHKTVASVQ